MHGVSTRVGSSAFFEERRPSSTLRRRLFFFGLAAGGMATWLLPWAWGNVLWVWAAVGVFSWWLWVTRYRLQLTNDTLSVQVRPFRSLRIPLAEIRSASPHMSYPWGVSAKGWSLRRAPGVKVFYTHPGAGVVLELESGRAVWVNVEQADTLVGLLKGGRGRRNKATSKKAKAASVSCSHG